MPATQLLFLSRRPLPFCDQSYWCGLIRDFPVDYGVLVCPYGSGSLPGIELNCHRYRDWRLAVYLRWGQYFLYRRTTFSRLEIGAYSCARLLLPLLPRHPVHRKPHNSRRPALMSIYLHRGGCHRPSLHGMYIYRAFATSRIRQLLATAHCYYFCSAGITGKIFGKLG